MGIIIRILVIASGVFISAYILPGVHVRNFITAIVVAMLLGILNIFIKPLLILLTLPVTILTLGLFLLVINAFLVVITDSLIGGFWVDSFGWALVLSIILSVISFIMGRTISKSSSGR